MKFAKKIIIKNRIISLKHPSYFIADIAANHDGNLNRAKDLIWKAKEAGASNEMIAEYLQRELESWTSGTLRARSDFEAYTQLIERLSQ